MLFVQSPFIADMKSPVFSQLKLVATSNIWVFMVIFRDDMVFMTQRKKRTSNSLCDTETYKTPNVI